MGLGSTFGVTGVRSLASVLLLETMRACSLPLAVKARQVAVYLAREFFWIWCPDIRTLRPMRSARELEAVSRVDRAGARGRTRAGFIMSHDRDRAGTRAGFSARKVPSSSLAALSEKPLFRRSEPSRVGGCVGGFASGLLGRRLSGPKC